MSQNVKSIRGHIVNSSYSHLYIVIDYNSVFEELPGMKNFSSVLIR